MEKRCTLCEEIKSLDSFRRKESSRDGYASHCKECARERQNQRYREVYYVKAKKRNQERFLETKQKLFEYKEQQCCAVCGVDEPVCLDFHHLDPNEKDFTISTGQNRSWEKILEEIQKCVVLCKNCHAKVHSNLIILEGKLTRS